MAMFCVSVCILVSAANGSDEDDDSATDADEEIKGQITSVQNAPIPKTEFEIQTEITEVKSSKAKAESRVKTLRRRSKNIKDAMAKPENQPATVKAQLSGLRSVLDGKIKGPPILDRKDVLEALKPLQKLYDYEMENDDSTLTNPERDAANAVADLRTALRQLLASDAIKAVDVQKFREQMLNDEKLKAYDAAIDLSAKLRAQTSKNYDDMAGKTETLVRVYGDRLNKLSEALAGQTKNQAKVVNALVEKLPMILGILCALFAVIILLVRFFPDATQIEWVGSGQVIQLLTVVTLLLIILCLAVTDILKENIIGTLLGGIGGYVLSQGIGRAAARAATRNQQAHEASATV
jgi:hypothetical protein